MQLFAIPEWFVWSSFIFVFLATLWKGSPQARWVAGSQFAQMAYQRAWYCIGDVCLGGLYDERFWQYVLQDVILTGIAVACAVTSRRYWTVWVASFGLCALAHDFEVSFEPLQVTPWAAKWGAYIWTYVTLGVVLSDVWANLREGRTDAQAVRKPLTV